MAQMPDYGYNYGYTPTTRNAGTTSSGSSRTTSSGSGSSGQTSSSRQVPSDNSRSTLELILQGYGIPPGPFGALIDQAVRLGWTAEELTAQIYASPAFAAMFPGIFREDGSLRMTPYEYRQMADQYLSTARLYGISDLDPARIGKLIAGNVSLQEFADRMEAIRRVSEFKPAFEEFKQVLRARGIPTTGLDTDKDLVNFMLGKGPKQFYQLWDELNVGLAARMAGAKISQKMVRSIARRLPGVASEAELQLQMQELARHIRTTLPLSKIHKFGLTKKDLVTLEFGGPNQAAIFEKVQRLGLTQQLFEAERSTLAQPEIGRVQQSRPQTL